MVGGGTRQQVTVSRWHGRGRRAPGVGAYAVGGLRPGCAPSGRTI